MRKKWWRHKISDNSKTNRNNRIQFSENNKAYPEVLEVTYEAMKNHYGNASSIHNFGRDSRRLLDDATS